VGCDKFHKENRSSRLAGSAEIRRRAALKGPSRFSPPPPSPYAPKTTAISLYSESKKENPSCLQDPGHSYYMKKKKPFPPPKRGFTTLLKIEPNWYEIPIDVE